MCRTDSLSPSTSGHPQGALRHKVPRATGEGGGGGAAKNTNQ